MSKKILIIISIVIIILGGIFLYILFSKNPTSQFGIPSNITDKVRKLFPFAPNDAINSDNNDQVELPATSTATTTVTVESKIPRLRKITSEPTSGATIIEKKVEKTIDNKKVTETVYFVRYMDKATGHIIETPYNSYKTEKISNKTIPKVEDALFGSNGNSVIARLLDDDNETIKTYFISLQDKKIDPTASATENEEVVSKEAVVSILEDNIRDIVLSPLKTQVAYLTYTDSGGKITVGSLDGTKKNIIYEDLLRELLLSWPTQSKIVISTKPSGLATGFAWSMNSNGGNLSKIAGGELGLTVLSSPNLEYTLIGIGGEKDITLKFKNQITNEDRKVRFFSLPEKCVWSQNTKKDAYCGIPTTSSTDTFPESWYLGITKFNDNIWKIDEKGENLILNKSKYTKESIDIIKPSISSDDKYMIFTNKNDLSLWALWIPNEDIEISD